MIPKLRACYFDLDGTLINEEGEIASSDLDSIHRLHELGIAVGIATGRPWFAARQIAQQIGANAPSLFFSGAQILYPHNGTLVRQIPIQLEDAQHVIDMCRDRNWYVEAYSSNEYFIERRTTLTGIHAEYLKQFPVETDLKALIKTHSLEILKLVIVHESTDYATVTEHLRENTSHSEIAVAYGAGHPNISFVNITSEDAKRLSALEMLLEHLQASPGEIMAFGDGEADIPFLSSVGFGVAMGNAPTLVKESARYTTETVSRTGVAQFLRRFFTETSCES